MHRFGKTIITSLLFGALVAAGGPGVAHATLGIDFSAAAPYDNGSPAAITGVAGATGFTTVGWSFTANSDLYLTRLGVYDADKDRIHSEQHQVGIWSAGSLLGSVAIDESKGNTPEASAAGQALFHYSALSNALLLHAGQTYYVGATLYSGAVLNAGTLVNSSDFDVYASINTEVPVAINPDITYVSSAYATSATNQLTLPGTVNSAAIYSVGANIDVTTVASSGPAPTPTPVPAAAWLLGSGLLGLVGIRRKNIL